LPETSKGVIFVLENGCDDPFTYRIDGREVTPVGHGDLHDHNFDKYMRSGSFADVETIADGTKEGMNLHYNKCPYSIRVYPSQDMVELLTNNTPAVVTVSVAIAFVFVVLMFFVRADLEVCRA